MSFCIGIPVIMQVFTCSPYSMYRNSMIDTEGKFVRQNVQLDVTSLFRHLLYDALFKKTRLGRQSFDSVNIRKTFRCEDLFQDVFFSFRWLSMMSSHPSLGIPLGIFPFIFNFTTTLSGDSSSPPLHGQTIEVCSC